MVTGIAAFGDRVNAPLLNDVMAGFTGIGHNLSQMATRNLVIDESLANGKAIRRRGKIVYQDGFIECRHCRFPQVWRFASLRPADVLNIKLSKFIATKK